jgi:hypothetical protein
MRKSTYYLIIISFTSFLLLTASCNEEVSNTITIKGNSETTLNTGYVISDIFYVPSVTADCNPALFAIDIWIKFTSGASLWIRCYTSNESLLVPLGSLKMSNDCGEGFIASFFQAPGKANAGLCFTNGKLDILKEGDIFKVDINLSISADCGSGTVKGTYTGKFLLRI